jgi:outer membrane protein TolC
MSRPCDIVIRPLNRLSLARALCVLLLPLVWTGWVGTVGLATAAAAERRQMQLSLSDATALALQHNLDIQIAGITPRIRDAQITEQNAIFDVTARGSVAISNSQLLTDSTSFINDPEVGVRQEDINGDGIPETLAIAGQEDEQIYEGEVGVAQLTPYGGTYEVTLRESRLDTNRRVIENFLQPGARSDLYTTELELRLRQPLLKDFGAEVTQNQILIARNNLSISQEEFSLQIISSTAQVQQTYWDLVFRRQDLEVRRQQLDLAQRLLAQVRRQVEVGTLAPIEVLQAETDIARIDQTIIIAINAVRDTEDRLKRTMNLSLTGEFADVEILPTDAPQYTVTPLTAEAEIAQALQQRHDLVQAKLALENQNITLVFNQNQTLPTLDLQASFRFNGIDDSLGEGIGELSPGRNRWEVGMVFSYPLANRAAKSRLQQNRLAIRQQLLRIQDLEETISEDVRTAVRAVQASAQLVQASKAASRLAAKQLDAEEKKLRVGLATVFTVLQFQEDLAVERSAEIRSLTEHLKSLVRLEAAKNTLLQSYNIVIQDNGPRLR